MEENDVVSLEHRGLSWIFVFLYIFLIFSYTVFGAVLFMLVEGKEQDLEKEMDDNMCVDIIADVKWRMRSSYHGSSYDNIVAVEDIVNCYERLRGYNHQYPLTNFHNALVYAISIYTTIGYGMSVTLTWYGCLLTVIYGIIGIPLFFGFHEDMSGRLYRGYVWLANSLFRQWRVWRDLRRLPAAADAERHAILRRLAVPEDEIEDLSMSLRVTLTAVFCALMYLVIATAVFIPIHDNPDWTYWEGWYFFFQSCFLIGFGDLYPMSQWKGAMALLFIIPGITILSLAILPLQFQIKKILYKLSAWLFVTANRCAGRALDKPSMESGLDTGAPLSSGREGSGEVVGTPSAVHVPSETAVVSPNQGAAVLTRTKSLEHISEGYAPTGAALSDTLVSDSTQSAEELPAISPVMPSVKGLEWRRNHLNL